MAGGGALWPGAVLTLVLALWAGPLALLALGVAALAVARLALRRIGGQTGDVLGAVQLVSEVAVWVTLATTLAA